MKTYTTAIVVHMAHLLREIQPQNVQPSLLLLGVQPCKLKALLDFSLIKLHPAKRTKRYAALKSTDCNKIMDEISQS